MNYRHLRPGDTVTLRDATRADTPAATHCALLLRQLPHMADRSVDDAWDLWYARSRGPCELVSAVKARGDLPADWVPVQESLNQAPRRRPQVVPEPDRRLPREPDHDPVTGEVLP